MGYTTQFKGVLKFTSELTATQLSALSKMLGEDCRDHKDWPDSDGLYYIDLELTEEFDGLQWDGSEKTYCMDRLVNVVIKTMRQTWPNFGLSGQLQAQGEEIGDVWMLTIEDGLAVKKKLAPPAGTCACPECGYKFIPKDQA